MSDSPAPKMRVTETDIVPGRPVRYFIRAGDDGDPGYTAEEYLADLSGSYRGYKTRLWSPEGRLVSDRNLIQAAASAITWHNELTPGFLPREPGYADAEAALLRAARLINNLRGPVALADAAGMTAARMAEITCLPETELARLVEEARESGAARLRVAGTRLPTPDSPVIRYVLQEEAVPGSARRQPGGDAPLWYADEDEAGDLAVTTSSGKPVEKDPVFLARVRLAIAWSRNPQAVDLGDDPPFPTAPAGARLREIEDELARAGRDGDPIAFSQAVQTAVAARIPAERMAEITGRPVKEMESLAVVYRATLLNGLYAARRECPWRMDPVRTGTRLRRPSGHPPGTIWLAGHHIPQHLPSSGACAHPAAWECAPDPALRAGRQGAAAAECDAHHCRCARWWTEPLTCPCHGWLNRPPAARRTVRR